MQVDTSGVAFGRVGMTGTCRRLAVALMLPALYSCTQVDISDLEAFVEEEMAKPGKGAPPLPEFKRVPPYSYKSRKDNVPSPFRLYYEEEDVVADTQAREAIPPQWLREIDVARNREELEYYELDSLRMVGTINRVDQELWAIILDPENVIHRVRVNNYMGRNIGKIISITDGRVEVRELIKDSQGRWTQREAAIALAEEQG